MHDGCPRGHSTHSQVVPATAPVSYPPLVQREAAGEISFSIIFVCLRSWFTSSSCTVLQVQALNSKSGSDGSPSYTRKWQRLEELFCRDTLGTSLKSASLCASSTPTYLLRLSTSCLRRSLSFLKILHQSRSQRS